MNLTITFYRNLSLLLLGLNIALLTFFFWPCSPRPSKNGRITGDKAREYMNFTDQQHQQFLEYANLHRERMHHYNEQQRRLLGQYFLPLTALQTPSADDSLLMAIQRIEGQKIEETYQHFQGIKALLSKEQYAGFEAFVHKATDQILQLQKPPKPKK
jgi:hypothetical protein